VWHCLFRDTIESDTLYHELFEICGNRFLSSDTLYHEFLRNIFSIKTLRDRYSPYTGTYQKTYTERMENFLIFQTLLIPHYEYLRKTKNF